MSDLPIELLHEVEDALRDGNKIEAIKRYCAATGAGLKEGKESVEALERMMRQASPSGTLGPPKPKQPMDEETASQITEFLFAGEKIQAIKVYREAKGGGLKEAKQAIDALEADLRRECPEKFQFAAKSGCLSVLLFGGIVAGLIGYVAG